MSAAVGFNEMQVFVTVVTEGSFTAAAKRLATNKAHISRTVQRIEEKFGAQLLNRSSRRLSVTEVGRDYFERASSILAAVEAAESAVALRTQEPKGRLKVTATSEFGTTRVDFWIADFLARWPGVGVETVYTNRFVDIIHEGIDVAIRIGALKDSSLAARKLGDVTYGLYASPAYLEKRGDIATLGALQDHDGITKASDGRASWTLKSGHIIEKVSPTPRCVVDNILAARNLALAGLGVALVPQFLAETHAADRKLVRVLPAWSGMTAPVHAVFVSSRYMDPKVRRFIDHCRDVFDRP